MVFHQAPSLASEISRNITKWVWVLLFFLWDRWQCTGGLSCLTPAYLLMIRPATAQGSLEQIAQTVKAVNVVNLGNSIDGDDDAG